MPEVTMTPRRGGAALRDRCSVPRLVQSYIRIYLALQFSAPAGVVSRMRDVPSPFFGDRGSDCHFAAPDTLSVLAYRCSQALSGRSLFQFLGLDACYCVTRDHG